MSYSDIICDWCIIDQDGNELEITDVFPSDKPFTIKATEYDPNASVSDALRQAIDGEFSNDT